MNIFEEGRNTLVMSIWEKFALVLILAILLWSTGAPFFLQHAKAASVLQFSDTLSNSNNSSESKHTLQFTLTSAAASAGQSIKISFDQGNTTFTLKNSSATTSDYTISGLTVVSACGASNQATVADDLTARTITFTLCPSSSIATGTPVTIVIGAVANTRLVINPAGTGSYPIQIGGTIADSGETRVAILPNVTLTASVNTSFTFTVTGLATSTNVNGVNTTGSSTATTLPFGTLSSSNNASSTFGQQLQVSTNARNGFAVTVQENQPPTSGTGGIIYLFQNGATTSTPIPWVPASGLLDQQNTYGELGVTSDDQDEGGGEWVATSTTRYAGNIDQPRVIFSHTGPADGATQNKGLAKVAYKIQITDLQQAGNDYTNTLTYVATPTF